jgi:Leucine-rich repeat (LRR) protein
LLASFTIIDFTIADVSPVNLLTSLRALDVNTYCKTELRFSQFPLLENCALEWRPKASSLFEHTGIRDLFINKYPGKDLSAFSKMASLKSLALASPRLATLKGVEALTGLTFLGIYVARRLTSLHGLEVLTNLERLEVNNCRHIGSIASIAGLRRLRQVHICTDGDIESIRPLENLEDLEVFLFYESTNVLDGDLSVLKRLPKLRTVAFMERPHYSHRRSDLPG